MSTTVAGAARFSSAPRVAAETDNTAAQHCAHTALECPRRGIVEQRILPDHAPGEHKVVRVAQAQHWREPAERVRRAVARVASGAIAAGCQTQNLIQSNTEDM
jgi:hypothetical protein